MVPGATERVQGALGLGDDELCDALGLGPVELLAGDGDLLPQTSVLDELVRAALTDGVDPAVLRRWARLGGEGGRTPVDLLRAREYAAFEAALASLAERGLVIRRRT